MQPPTCIASPILATWSRDSATAGTGPLGLDLLRGGKSAPDALAALLAVDDGGELRQVAMVDSEGRVAAHTGSRCTAEAGHHIGDGYSCQANIMLRDTVWDAMATAYE